MGLQSASSMSGITFLGNQSADAFPKKWLQIILDADWRLITVYDKQPGKTSAVTNRSPPQILEIYVIQIRFLPDLGGDLLGAAVILPGRLL